MAVAAGFSPNHCPAAGAVGFPLLARRSGTPARAWSPGRAFPFSPHSHPSRVRERRSRRAIPLRSLHPAVGNDGAGRGPFFAPCRPRQRTRRFLAAVGTHTGGWRDDRSAVRKLSQTAQRPGRRPDTRDAGPVFSCPRTHTGGRVNVCLSILIQTCSFAVFDGRFLFHRVPSPAGWLRRWLRGCHPPQA